MNVHRVRSVVLPCIVISAYLFMYLPIIVLICFSFNSGAQEFSWSQFTTRWYRELLQQGPIWDSLKNSVIVGCGAVIASIIMGSLFVFFGTQGRMRVLHAMFYTNLGIPEIVIAVGLLGILSYFVIPLGLCTLIFCHTILGLGYVVPLLYTRYRELDKRYIEASLDLGATPFTTFFKIVLPLLSPAIFSAALLVFVVSFDDFIISFFCAGASSQTLPLYIFSLIHAGASPVIAALSTILLGVNSILVIMYLYWQARCGELPS